MRLCFLILSLLPFLASGLEVRTVYSRSHQFVVMGPASLPSAGTEFTPSADGVIKVQAEMLTVMAERLKEALLQELNIRDAFTGKIELIINTTVPRDANITVVSTHFANGWHFQVIMGLEVEQLKLLKAVTHALLLEMANRGRNEKLAELPTWLVEGVALHLYYTLGPKSIIVAENWMLDQGNLDPLRATRQILTTNTPLSFTELSFPLPEQLVEPRLKVFQSSSHFFVYELLRVPSGPGCLVTMIQSLSSTLNWQTAFLFGFQSSFQRTLDVEKWWALTLHDLTGRDQMRTWPVSESLRRLDEILTTHAEVVLSTNDLPMKTMVSLERVFQDWEWKDQKPVLQMKVTQLMYFEPNFAPAVLPLLVDYRSALQSFMEKRQKMEGPASSKSPVPSDLPLIRETLKQLNNLQKRAARLRSEELTTAQATK